MKEVLKVILILILVIILIIGIVYISYRVRGVKADKEGHGYLAGKLPVISDIYLISGTVLRTPYAAIRQVQTLDGTVAGLDGAQYGRIQGSQFGGKVVVLLDVDEWTILNGKGHELAEESLTVRTVFLKMIDTKANLLHVGDHVRIKCRFEVEAIASSSGKEILGKDMYTYEFDGCKLHHPRIQVKE